MDKKRHLQLGDIAAELGVSTSTVSRAMSGKGNISQQTRDRINAYIERFGYQPNAIAQRLAEGRTGNIGVVLPSDAFTRQNDFFQTTLLGICQEAANRNYDVLVTTVNNDDISYLKRLMSRRSVDGVILMRSLENDPSMQYLCEIEADFVTIGSVERRDVEQVDIPHMQACRELTAHIMPTSKRIGLLVGDTNYIVNKNRWKGFLSAMKEAGEAAPEYKIFTEIIDNRGLKKAVDELLCFGADTLICGDDNTCMATMEILDEKNLADGQPAIASLYDNLTLKSRGITAINVDDTALGAAAVIKLISRIEEKDISVDVTPGYQIYYRQRK